MSHLGFVAPPYLGHLNPMVTLATTLQARGHGVTFFGLEDVRDVAASRGIPFVAIGARTHPAGTLATLVAHMAAPGGAGLFRILRDMSSMTRMLCAELPAACRARQVDGLVTDQLEPAGALVSAHLGLPYVTVATALPIRRDPAVPPPFVDWRFDPTPWGLSRNRGGYRVADLLMRPYTATIAREGRKLGLRRDSLDDCLSPLADLTQVVPALDFPRPAVPTVHPCGPLRGREAPVDLTPFLRDERPMVFASLGTLQGGRAALFRRIAEVCQRLDLHLVIAHGGRLAAEAAADLPGNPTVRAFVPQRALLCHAALAVTNGGLNTVLDAASAGVPMLVVPIAFEQGAIGARVEHAGVGQVLPRRRLTSHRLETAMRDLLSDAILRQRTARVARALAVAGGVEQAASIVTEVMRTGRPARHAAPPIPEPA